MREHGADIAAYDTTADALDLVAVRQALGLAQWDVWGVSYGTRVAFELMRHDPAGIRSVVMEAAVPPEAAVFGGGLKHDEGSNNALLLSHLCRDEFPFEPMAALRHPPAAAAFDGARSPLRELVLCPDWAGSADATVNMPVESDLPVLFLSGAYDVATPYCLVPGGNDALAQRVSHRVSRCRTWGSP